MNVTHAYDGYMIRELNRRANYDAGKLEKAAMAIEIALLGEDQGAASLGLKRMERIAKWCNTVSLRAVEFIEIGMLADIDKDYLRQLNALIESVLAQEPFPVRSIFDEVACAPNHVNQMKQLYNDLLGEAYRSTWLFDVIQLLTGDSYHKIQPTYSEEVEVAIRNNSYAIG